MSGEWYATARQARRALQTSYNRGPAFSIRLCGHDFRVTYEARRKREGHRIDRDFPVLRAMAAGKSCVLDVGSNMGMASLVMNTSMAAGGRIYAFEGSEFTCRIARQNLALNDLEQHVSVVNTLVSERSGEVVDFCWNFDSGGNSMLPGYMGATYTMQKTTLSLDDFCDGGQVRPDFVKIDVEGAEVGVLKGFVRTMASAGPPMMVELHNWNARLVPNVKTILDLIRPLDYQIIYLPTKAPVADASVFEALVSRGRNRCHVILARPTADLSGLAEIDTSSL